EIGRSNGRTGFTCGQGGCRTCKKRSRISDSRRSREVPLLLVIRIEPEELVFDDCSTDSETPLLAPILRLVWIRNECPVLTRSQEGEWVGRAPIVVAIVEECLSVQLVGSALGHGVDHAARSASVFCGIVRAVDLELLHSGLAGRVRGTS